MLFIRNCLERIDVTVYPYPYIPEYKKDDSSRVVCHPTSMWAKEKKS